MTLPKSIRTATVPLYGVDLVVHHLDNGERVIEEASMLALLEAMASLPSAPDDAEMVQAAIEAIFGPTKPASEAA